MDDFRKKIVEQESEIEKLVKRIPGFNGYKEKENRRAADKFLRDYIVRRIDEIRDDIQDIIENIEESEISFLDDFSKILKNLTELRDKISFANYGDSVFFGLLKINETLLDKIYEFDASLIDKIQELSLLIEEPKNIKTHEFIKTIKEKVSNISELFNKRKEILKQTE